MVWFRTEKFVRALVVVLLSLSSTAFGLKCYICTPDHPKRVDKSDVSEINEMAPNARLCSEWNKSIEDEFIKECPKGYDSCVTKFDGQFLRKCGWQAIDDCKTMSPNGALPKTYCSCTGELCNNPEQLTLKGPKSEPIKKGSFLVGDKSSLHIDTTEGSGNYDYNYGDDEDQHFPGGDPFYPDYSDTTDPPPLFIDEGPEHGINSFVNKFDRGSTSNDLEKDDIEFDDDNDSKRTPSSDTGKTNISAATPLRKTKEVVGVLLMSTLLLWLRHLI